MGDPGMKVLQFAFGGKEEDRQHFMPVPYDPTSIDDSAIIYTSTQDSNTAVGWWYRDSSLEERSEMTAIVRQQKKDERYEIKKPNWDMIDLGMKSDCLVCIVSMQDMLGLGPSARMNTCGKRSGNWRWRCTAEQFAGAPWQRLAALTRMSYRWRKSG